MIVTAALTTRVVRVVRDHAAAVDLIDEILRTDHEQWETILSIGDVEFHQSKAGGPYPDHQFRISVRPASGLAACNYTDNRDPVMPVATSWNRSAIPSNVDLILNGTIGAVFPAWAAIPIEDARDALLQWLETRQRPTCINWRAV